MDIGYLGFGLLERRKQRGNFVRLYHGLKAVAKLELKSIVRAIERRERRRDI
jgi:hypothetical protein